MGKKLEIFQWVLIIGILVYLIIVSILVYIYVPKFFIETVIALGMPRLIEIDKKVMGQCEVKEDCTYGSTTIAPGLPIEELFDTGGDYSFPSGEVNGCWNIEKIEELKTKPFGGVCACMNSVCSYVT